MSKNESFFDKDTPHGLAKRLMLKKYLQAYIEKTQNEKFNLKTVYIDGFAGEGRYGNEWPSEIEKYGSPLIALMVSLGFYYKHDMLKQKEDKKDKPKMPNTHETDLLENRNQETDRSKASVKAGNKFTDKPGDEEKQGQPTNTEKKQDSIWGWSTSELEPEDELSIELEKRNKRSEVFGENANITLHFIESNIETYRKLAANVELLIMKFLERHYPEYTYGFRQMEGNALFEICKGSFNLTVKVFHQEFAKTTAPPMLRDSSVRSLTFLDPYGFKDTPMAHVQQFVPGSGNEILINFMSSFVNRFVSKCPEHVTQLYGISLDVAKYYGIDPSDLEDSKDELVEFVKFVIHFCQPEREFEFSNKIQKCTSNYEAFLKRKTQCKFSINIRTQG
ncbi:uncharacterized protein LOC132753206 [Ruditapes philippinarum]|uniref:uncharacterized protein LOC132753206 n=1 Tax=Ruditapes philippinarum TaxID=129788 RepID=UPI00295B149F|nr:uncharacterized protein LOC132753206 [Ruditapes philippinarum]XP_060599631.1 uncharacterized protein LOC132753206 [Ruditapes philippinarum]